MLWIQSIHRLWFITALSEESYVSKKLYMECFVACEMEPKSLSSFYMLYI